MNSNISMTLYNKLKGNFLALFTEKSAQLHKSVAI